MIRWTGEAEPGRPYWWSESSAASDPSDVLPERTDILIIGAGYTGLSAAIAAHGGGAKVVVVDAGVPGHGASTRNGGMFGAHPRLAWKALAKNFGPATADAIFGEAKPALEFVKRLIKQENIDCDLQQTGRIQLAYTAAHFVTLKQLAGDVRAKGDVAVRVIERADLSCEINTERYFGGILFPEHCAIHPRKFHDGLLASMRSRAIAVMANAPVTRLLRQSGGFLASTPHGNITAHKVILATNGYTPRLFRWHQRRVFPLPSYIIATETLPQDLIAEIAPGRRMMVETRARHSYFRISPDGRRILFGGRASMRDIPMESAAERLHATMSEIWPQLAGTRLSHVWGGNTGFSFTHTPTVGEHDGLYYAMGYSGSGTVMAPYLGAKVGCQAVGAAGGETAFSKAGLRPSWLHPGTKPHFLKAADIWYRFWVDKRETRNGR